MLCYVVYTQITDIYEALRFGIALLFKMCGTGGLCRTMGVAVARLGCTPVVHPTPLCIAETVACGLPDGWIGGWALVGVPV